MVTNRRVSNLRLIFWSLTILANHESGGWGASEDKEMLAKLDSWENFLIRPISHLFAEGEGQISAASQLSLNEEEFEINAASKTLNQLGDGEPQKW